jgi:transcriptional regulator with XRE-family HTH domain
MTPSLPQSRRARRARLGAELRRLRQLSGVSGQTVADALGVNRASVSRVEAGERPLSMPDLATWAQVLGATGDDLSRLEWLAEQALTDAIGVPELQAALGEAGIQADIGNRLERTSRLIVSYCTGRLTGLLQTPEYARRVYSLLVTPAEIGAAVAERMNRQQILYGPARRLEFILTEASLRWRTGSPDFLLPQMDRLVTLASLPNVALYVIPSDASMRTTPGVEFTLYDERDGDEEPVVAIELPHDYIETGKAQPYRDKAVLLRQSALSGDEAIAFIRDLARRLG